MKLLRFGPVGGEKPGLLDDQGAIRDLSGTVADISNDTLGEAALDALRAIDPTTLPLVEGDPRIGPDLPPEAPSFITRVCGC